MQVSKKIIKHAFTLLLFSTLSLSFNPAMAKSADKAMMGDVQKARESLRQKGVDHYKHLRPADKSEEFRGVYYGYLPCSHCAGIKMTLSLKNKKNYLLVTQYAQESIKEYYEKGKYIWDDISGILTLVPREKGKELRKFYIKDEFTVIQLTPNEKRMKGDQDDFSLIRADKNNAREVHIH
ncbi:MAG: copper resistance protein NlpE [Methyloprofundus sp.]|nr:copper resistance protein NlpE [Methyloprofundus sp.]